MSERSILYCGDTSLSSAAAYLAGMMTRWGVGFEYVPSEQPLRDDQLDSSPSLFVFSDYPAKQASIAQQERVVEQVAAGAGLLMIGGWESYHGLGGDWDNTPIGDVLPVWISEADDRMNCDGPVLLQPTMTGNSHPITAGLPWSERPPLIGGFNRFEPKPNASLILEAIRLSVRVTADKFAFESRDRFPLLVTSQFGSGKTAALATDVAPHWIGPMVDWGDQLIAAQASGTDGVEVGNLYEQFFRQLIEWATRPSM